MSAPFSGARIRALRERLGLSQVELAATLGISNVTVNRWEHDRAQPQPSTIERLLRLDQDGLAAPGDASSKRLGNLPVTFTPLVGRAADLDAVAALLESRQLVTITGTAGAGKTRLAIESGRHAASRYPEGVWFVDLAAVIDPGDVVHAVARVLGVRESGRKPLLDRLADAYRDRPLLIILDNCEHLRAACAALAARLLATPGASVCAMLATGRVPLGVPGEAVYPLRPLTAEDASALFVQRAREHQPGLNPDAEESRAIAEICRRLDGLPLAIELAAARASVLTVEQIAGRLDRRFDLLRASDVAPPRQRALDTAIAWSCDLLDPDEAALFRGLGVFVGWFDLAAVEHVAGSSRALDALAGLARQSMIVVELDTAARTARYRLLESLAAFSRRWLEASGDARAAADRHAAYYGALARTLADGLHDSKQAALLGTLDREHDNLIAALEWMLSTGEAETATAVAAAMGPYWRMRGRYAEGAAWLKRALAQGGGALDGTREAALNQLGLLQYRTSDFGDARQTLAEAIALARQRDNRHEEAQALSTLGLVLVGQLELSQATQSHQAALFIYQEQGDRRGAAMSTLYLGNLANLRGQHRVAERSYQEAWTLIRRTGDTAAEALILSNLGEISARTGRYARALGYYERALALFRAVGDPDRLAAVATNTAEVQLVLGEREAAAPLAAGAAAQFRGMDDPAHLASALYVQAAAEAAIGNLAHALALFRESLALYHDMGDWIDVVYVIEAIARLLAEGADAVVAARLLGGVETIRQRDQVADYPLFDSEGALDRLRAALGGATMAAYWEEGSRLSPEQLVAEAMLVGTVADGEPIDVLIQHRPQVSRDHRDGSLTARQIDVLRLVAAGLSNREIGQELGISDRTVERHLTAIFGALGVDRRSAAVARATASGLLKDRSPT